MMDSTVLYAGRAGTVLEPAMPVYLCKPGEHSWYLGQVMQTSHVTAEHVCSRFLLTSSAQCFSNPSIAPVFLSPSFLHPLNTSLFITSLLPPGGCDYSHILIHLAPSSSNALLCICIKLAICGMKCVHSLHPPARIFHLKRGFYFTKKKKQQPIILSCYHL